MGDVKLNSSGGGSVTLTTPSTASNLTVTLPSASGTLATTSGSTFSTLTVTGSVNESSATNGYDAYTASRASRSFCWGLDASGNYGIWDTTSGANNRLLIDSSGNLGLGVTPSGWSPGVSKAVQLSTGSLYTYSTDRIFFGQNVYINSSNSDTYIATAPATTYRQYNGIHAWYTAPSGTAGNAISFTQAMTLDASGNWSVGNTGIGLSNNNSIQYSVSNAQGYITHVNGTSSGQGYWIFAYNSSQIGSITQNGTTGVLYNITSDQRLKTNVKPAESAIQSILDFPVDQFDWIESGEHQDFGAVAQKAINVIPEMVSVPADPDEMWGIDWSKAVPRLIKTIQELSAKNSELESRLAALEGK